MDIEIPDHEWELSGGEDDPAARMLCQLVICGCPMHLEAVAAEVKDEDGKRRDIDYCDQAPDWIKEAIVGSTDSYAARTATIMDRTYILIATPHAV